MIIYRRHKLHERENADSVRYFLKMFFLVKKLTMFKAAIDCNN